MKLPTVIGHAPEDIRAAFLNAIDRPHGFQAFVEIGEVFHDIGDVFIALTLCTDTLSRAGCEALDIPPGPTYGEASLVLRQLLAG